MNVRELIKKLKELDADDMEVRYYDEGFHEPVEVIYIRPADELDSNDAYVMLV